EEEGDNPVNEPDNYSYQYYRKDGEQNVAIGAWSKQEIEVSRENPNLLGDVILYQIDFFWRDVNHMREC
ncbi:MAG: hypothetical protein J6Y71_04440, partial [Ruminococcus sp.]|nr:hypothetical protein [Ruminococcus sp.]